jgi:neutral ceramidase
MVGHMKSASVQVDITPPVGVPLFGYSEKERDQGNTGVHDPLFAKAVVIANDEEKLAIVGMDLIGIDINLTQKIRNLIAKKTNIASDNILLACTHTHCGPAGPVKNLGLEGFLEKYRPFFDFFENLREFYAWKIAGAVIEADNKLKESKFGIGSSHIPSGIICTNRNDPKGPMDPELMVIRLDSSQGEPHTIISNYACHPTVISYKSLEISADFPGYAMSLIEQVFPNTNSIFLNGSEGDISTRWTRREQTFNEAKRLGTILGTEIIKTTSQIVTKNDITIGCISKNIRLPLKEFPSLEKSKEIVDDKKRILDTLVNEKASHGEYRRAYTALLGAQFMQRYIETGITDRLGNSIETNIQVFKLNDLAIVSIPGELFTSIQLEIKSSSPFKKTVVISLANDYVGYILDADAYKNNLYESWATILSENAGSKLTSEVLRLLNDVK